MMVDDDKWWRIEVASEVQLGAETRSQGVAVPVIHVPVLVPVMAPAGELGKGIHQYSKIKDLTCNSWFVVLCKDATSNVSHHKLSTYQNIINSSTFYCYSVLLLYPYSKEQNIWIFLKSSEWSNFPKAAGHPTGPVSCGTPFVSPVTSESVEPVSPAMMEAFRPQQPNKNRPEIWNLVDTLGGDVGIWHHFCSIHDTCDIW